VTDLVVPMDHWTPVVGPVLEAVAPRSVWAPGDDQLSAQARAAGSVLEREPGERTDAAVVSGRPYHQFVSEMLAAATADGVGGQSGPPVIVVSATGWPHGDRDGYPEPELVASEQRRAYARTLPDPDERWLSAEPASLAYALEAGGERNGVRAPVDALLAGTGWRGLLLEGSGGIAVLTHDSRLAANAELRLCWSRLEGLGPVQEMLRRRDLDLARSLLAEAALRRALTEQTAATESLRSALRAALTELDSELDFETDAVRRLSGDVDRLGVTLAAGVRREQGLEQRLTEAEALVADSRETLRAERVWVAQQARGVASSQAWRVGHRLARAGRRLTFRGNRGTDAVNGIVARMERELDTGGS
jgi:hypothetical protein